MVVNRADARRSRPLLTAKWVSAVVTASTPRLLIAATVAALCLGSFPMLARAQTHPATASGRPVQPDSTPQPPAPGTFTAVAPARLLDTRIPGSPARPAAHGATQVIAAGVAGVPSTGVSAVAVNVTVVNPRADGYLTVYPAGGSRPQTSNLNFAAGRTTAAHVVVPVGANGSVTIYNGSTGTADLLVDMQGFYHAGATEANGTFGVVSPRRVLDTRTSTGGRRPGARGTLQVTVTGGTIPATGVSAVLLTLVATHPTAPGYLRANPARDPSGNLADVAFTRGRTVSAPVLAPVTNGQVTIYNDSLGTTDVIADVTGFLRTGVGSAPGAEQLDASPLFNEGNGAIAARGTRTTNPAPAGAGVVLVRLTVSGPAAGFVVVYPDATDRPTTSLINFSAGQRVVNVAVVAVGADGKLAVYNGSSGAAVVAVDVVATFQAGPGAALGAVTGKVTDQGGANNQFDLPVRAYSQGVVVAVAATDGSGRYVLAGLTPSSGYAICVGPQPPADAAAYPSQCSADFLWDGVSAPSDFTPVAIAPGATTAGIDFELGEPLGGDGALGGRVVGRDGAALAGVVVGVFTHGGDYSPTRSTTTRSDGGWQLRVPSPAPETVVCFDATKADGGLSPTGYLSRCYRDADWSRDPHHLPASAIRVALPANETRSGIDVTLPPAAAVNGTVRDAVSGDGLANVTVEVYDATHTDLVAPNAYTDSAGHYAVTGLAGSPGVLVCFVAGDARGGSTDTGYQPGCYRADGASAPTPVAVSPGSTAPDIDVALSPGGAFGGTVTAPPAYGEPPNILLSVFTADRQLAATVTATAAGNWQVGGLPPGNYTVCALVTNSDDIWPKCYVDVLWVDVVPPASATSVPVSVDHITRVHLSL